jgi:hypothetical protein
MIKFSEIIWINIINMKKISLIYLHVNL